MCCRFTPLPHAFNDSMWSELIRDCSNADIIFHRFSSLLSIKSEKWEDEREALEFMRDGHFPLLYFTSLLKVQWWLGGFRLAFQRGTKTEGGSGLVCTVHALALIENQAALIWPPRSSGAVCSSRG